jgi:hypothetical protein
MTSSIQDDPQAVAQLELMRGHPERGRPVHKAISWALRTDYEIQVGIALGIDDPSGLAMDKVQYWADERKSA